MFRMMIFSVALIAPTAALAQYSYDVSGSGNDGSSVSGNVDTNGRYVEGTITKDDGEEVTVSGEFTGRGQVTVEDDAGNSYDLEVE